MKNKILILILMFGLLSCSKGKPESPLLLPPDFEVVPDLNKKPDANPQINDRDIQELRDLLL